MTIKNTGVFLLIIGLLLLAACQENTPEATATPEPPTATAVPPTAEPTAEPTEETSELMGEADMLDQSALSEHPWQWVSFTSPAEQFNVEIPENYLVQFNSDDTVNIVADCNNAAADYTSDGSSLSIMVGPMTMAACPPESRSDQFVNLLGGAAKFFFEEGNLYIDLMADGGTLQFSPAAAMDAAAGESTSELANMLGNMTYSGVLPDELITLLDGTATYDDGSEGTPFVSLVDHLIAVGDLDGDGVEDAAGFVVDNTTGSADFVYLVAVLGLETDATPVGAVLMGDRTPVISLTIEDGQAIVDFVTQGPEDVLCCPTLKVRKTFVVENGRFTESGSEEMGTASLADLNGTSWQLTNFNMDQEPVPAETEITLRIDEDQISGFAGCNYYNSPVTPGEDELPQSLIVGPIAATQKLCADAENAQETLYLERLAQVVAWRYDFGNLSLTYKLNDTELGELSFAPHESNAADSQSGLPDDIFAHLDAYLQSQAP